jgi:hypothetical protein
VEGEKPEAYSSGGLVAVKEERRSVHSQIDWGNDELQNVIMETPESWSAGLSPII